MQQSGMLEERGTLCIALKGKAHEGVSIYRKIILIFRSF
jgi:hypothetical protein